MNHLYILVFLLIISPIYVEAMIQPGTEETTHYNTTESSGESPDRISVITIHTPIIQTLSPSNSNCWYSVKVTEALEQTNPDNYGPIGSRNLRPLEMVILKHNPCTKDHSDKNRWKTRTLITTGLVAGITGLVAGALIVKTYNKK